MKRVLSLICLLTLVASAVVAQENSSESSWQRYTIKGDDFSIKLPLRPSMATNVNVISDRKTTRERRLGAYADGVVYTVLSVDDGSPKKALHNAIDQLASSKLWDRTTAKELTGDGFVGKQFLSSQPLGGIVQVLATKRRFYQFQVVGAPADDSRVKPFFASLMLTEKGDGIEVSDGLGVPYEPSAASATQVSTDQIFKSKDVDRKSLLIMKIEPMYTEQARQNAVAGTVVLKVVFSASGNVDQIQILSGLPFGLTERAIEAAQKIKFLPALKDGKYVSTWMQLEYNFNLY